MGRVHGERLGLLPRLRVWREVRPENAAVGTEVKLLRPRKAVWREERLAREGSGPVRELSCREREVRWERELRSEGSVPVREWEARLMVVTRLEEESHFMPSHWQNGVDGDHPGGDGVRDSRSFDMTAASSAAAAMMTVEKKKKKKKNGIRSIWSKCGWSGGYYVREFNNKREMRRRR